MVELNDDLIISHKRQYRMNSASASIILLKQAVVTTWQCADGH